MTPILYTQSIQIARARLDELRESSPQIIGFIAQKQTLVFVCIHQYRVQPPIRTVVFSSIHRPDHGRQRLHHGTQFHGRHALSRLLGQVGDMDEAHPRVGAAVVVQEGIRADRCRRRCPPCRKGYGGCHAPSPPAPCPARGEWQNRRRERSRSRGYSRAYSPRSRGWRPRGG